MVSVRNCKLCCINNSREPIHLPDKQEVILGRNKETKIKDVTMSKKQVKLVADFDTRTVKVTPLGINPSGVNGFCLKQNVEYTLKHSDRLELLLEQYIHEIVFDPAPSEDENKITLKRKIEDSAEEKNLKQPKRAETQKTKSWEEVDDKNLYVFTSEGVQPKEKIAAYDIDGTITVTKSGARFAKDAYDWQFSFAEVPKKLKELHNKGYKIVFFTNQAGLASGKTKLSDLKTKFEAIVSKLNLPIQIFIAPTRTIYRKPAPGMWDSLCKEKNDGVEIDLENSFYVGDAAGREANWAPKKKKDHSIADRLFALNIGLQFYTPEEHFLGARKIKNIMPEFDPRVDTSNLPLYIPSSSKLTSDNQEVVIMVGSPGSGKSFISTKYLVPKGYIHVNRDTLGSWQKCYNALEKYIQEKKCVVIDNTNPDVESRRRYIMLAEKYSVPIRCFVMNTTIHQAKHNNFFREITDKKHQQVTDIIINSYKTKYHEPTEEEGFKEILKINVVPKFSDEKLERLYKMYLLEK